MLHVRWMAIATLVATPFSVAAQENSTPKDPVNPAEASPLRYESAFAGYQPMPEEKEVDSEAWRAANNEVAALGGHGGHIKAESGFTPAPPTLDGAAAASGADGVSARHRNHGMDHKSKGN
jgi:hypothetical protein